MTTTTDPTNTDRAQRAQAALDTYRAKSATRDDGWDGRSDREALTDLLTDLMHLADQQAESDDEDAEGAERVVSTAQLNYESEKDED